MGFRQYNTSLSELVGCYSIGHYRYKYKYKYKYEMNPKVLLIRGIMDVRATNSEGIHTIFILRQ